MTSKVIENEWFYPLPDGTPNRKVIRYAGKEIRQGSMNPDTGNWVMSLKYGIPVLHDAPGLKKKAEENPGGITITATEGETTMDAVRPHLKENEFVTTLAGGAKKGRSTKRVPEEVKAFLREMKEICPIAMIIPVDMDTPGLDHAASWAMVCNELEIPWVAIRPHSSLTHEGADLRDHLEKFTLDEAEPIDLGVPHWNDPEPFATNPMTGLPLEHADWLVQRLHNEVLWIQGREDPWHLLDEDSSVFRPGSHRVLARANRLTLERYEQAREDGAPGPILTRLMKLCNPRSVLSALEASRAALECPLEDLGEHKYPLLTCTPNGILDLEHLTLRDHDPSLRFTKMVGVEFDPKAGCPQWLKHLEVWQPNPDNRHWLLKLIGLCLLGIQEAIIPIHFGRGSDGKSVFWNVIGYLLGDFDRVTPGATWMKDPKGSGGTGPNPAVARCEAARLVRSSETHMGALLDEVAVKGITGGDLVAARALYKGMVTWKPQMVLSFVTNHPMRIKDNSRGMQRRIRYIPWEANIPRSEQILDLDKKLIAEEGPGIFYWMAIGAQLYLEEGLNDVPPEIVAASRTLLGAEEDLEEFLEDVVDLSDPAAEIEKNLLYLAYSAWATKTALKPWSKQKLSRELLHKGWKDCRSGGVRKWKGVQLRKGAKPLLQDDEGGMTQ